MVRANKYFTLPEKAYADNHSAKGSYNGSMDKVIEKVKKKASENYFNNKQAQDYVVPLPEKTMPDNQAQSIDDLVEGKGGSGSKSSPNSITGRITPTPNPSGAGTPINPTRKSSNTFEYITREILQSIRDNLVKDPLNPTYQFSRKIGSKLIQEPNHALDIILLEATTLGIYAFIEGVLGKRIPKL